MEKNALITGLTKAKEDILKMNGIITNMADYLLSFKEKLNLKDSIELENYKTKNNKNLDQKNEVEDSELNKPSNAKNDGTDNSNAADDFDLSQNSNEERIVVVEQTFDIPFDTPAFKHFTKLMLILYPNIMFAFNFNL